MLVVCDMDRFEVHTNFTNSVKTMHAFDLDGLAEPENLDVLWKLFTDPEVLRPGETTASITERAAKQFAVLADGMRDRGIEPHRAAHFLMKLMFCMFAGDIGLLPGKRFSTRNCELSPIGLGKQARRWAVRTDITGKILTLRKFDPTPFQMC